MAAARELAISVVAVGVEHERQAQALREIGCDLAQGFLYSRPVTADEVIPTIRAMSRRACRTRAVFSSCPLAR